MNEYSNGTPLHVLSTNVKKHVSSCSNQWTMRVNTVIKCISNNGHLAPRMNGTATTNSTSKRCNIRMQLATTIDCIVIN
jgi:hypothetical protein